MRKITLFAAALILTLSASAQSSFNTPSKLQKTVNTSANRTSSRSLTVTILSTNNYIAGSTMDLLFDLTLATPDDEWGDSLAMTFPAGVTINGGSDPLFVATAGQPDEVLNLPIVSPLISWGDNDNVFGGIEPGLNSFYVNVTIPAGQTGPLTISWYISGDEYAGTAAPHFTTGTSSVNPLPSVADLAVVGTSNNKYLSIPFSMPRSINFSAELENNGATLTTTTNATVDIPGAAYSETTAVTVPFATYTNQSVSWANGVSLTAVGAYDVYFDVANAGDFNPIDNKDTLTVLISDSVYAYVDTVGDAEALGFGTGTEGVFGSIYDIPVSQNLTSISYYVPTPDPTALVSVIVYEVDANGPTTNILFESAFMATTGSGPTVFTQAANISLIGGNKYLIGIHKQATGDVFIGRNSSGYFADSHFAYFNSAWNEIGSLGFPTAQAIFANFGNSCHAEFANATDPSDSMTVNFTATSVYGGTGTLSSAWDFGDGSGTSSALDPTYTYSSQGAFSVCLTIDDGGSCTNTTCHNVTIDDGINGVSQIPAHVLSVYPNPTNGLVNILYNKKAQVSVYSIDGTMIKVKSTNAGTSEVNLSELPEGSYLLKITSEEGVSVKRISLLK